MFDPVAINRARKKKVWERCPDCGERLDIPVGAAPTVGSMLTVAIHAGTQRHSDALAWRRLTDGTGKLSQPDEKVEP